MQELEKERDSLQGEKVSMMQVTAGEGGRGGSCEKRVGGQVAKRDRPERVLVRGKGPV